MTSNISQSFISRSLYTLAAEAAIYLPQRKLLFSLQFLFGHLLCRERPNAYYICDWLSRSRDIVLEANDRFERKLIIYNHVTKAFSLSVLPFSNTVVLITYR